MEKLQLIKIGFSQSEILEAIPTEILDPIELEIINEYKHQQTITDQPTFKSVAQELLKSTQQPNLIKACIKDIVGQKDLDKAQIDIALFGLRSQAQRKIFQLISASNPDEKTLSKLMDRLQILREAKQNTWMEPVAATHWKELTKSEEDEINLLVDWFRDNEVPIKKGVLYSFLATTDGGKTIIKTWFAYQLIRTGANVLYLAQEEPVRDTIRRIHQAALNLTEVRYKELTQDGFEEVGKQYNLVSEEKGYGEFWVAEWSHRRIDEIARYIKDWNSNNPKKIIDALVVDYGKLVEVSGSRKNLQEWERISKIFDELKQLAMKENVAVITSIQLNRDATAKLHESDRTPDLYDVAGAYEATMHANYIWAVRKQDQAEVDLSDPNSSRGTYTLTVLKTKYGNLRKGDFKIFDWKTTHNLNEITIADYGDSYGHLLM